MQLSANKGEWSEFYAFLKILSDKILHSADEKLALIPNSFLKVLSIIRYENSKELIYEIDRDNDRIVLISDSEEPIYIPILHVTRKLTTILKKIKEGAAPKGAFVIPDARGIMDELCCTKIKSASSKKTDITLKIEDSHTGTQPLKGFNIKSKIGGLSTLLNASGATNFEFEIVDSTTEWNRCSNKPLIGLNRILPKDKELKFIRIPNEKFRENLIMVDSRMPELTAEVIKAYYLGFQSTVQGLTLHLKKHDPLGMNAHKHFYEYKIQEFLLAIAFGMQPSKPWNGSYETHGGYIIVKENGELACYHVYDRDKFREFLFLNTKLETPSTKRHKFGKIYECEGRKFLQLNLQVRFIK